MSITLLLVENQNVVRQGLRTLLEKEHEFQVVGEAENGTDGIALYTQHQPDVTLMDITMPRSRINGIEATQRILKLNPQAKIIALSVHNERVFVRRMLAAGAKGYLLKDCYVGELIAAVHSVVAGKTYLSNDLKDLAFDDYRQQLRSRVSPQVPELSERERQVLRLIAEEKNYKEIAYDLGLSAKTVEAHRRNIMEKLNIDNVVGLAKYAIREGIIDVTEPGEQEK